MYEHSIAESVMLCGCEMLPFTEELSNKTMTAKFII
jgi:hypothetical protein